MGVRGIVNRFEGKSVIVTGGANGIGRATAMRLLAEGAHVSVFDIADESSDSVAQLFHSADSGALTYYSTDLTREDQVEHVVASVLADRDSVEAVVAVAGLSQARKRIDKISVEEWDRYLAVNLTNPFLVARAVLPSMRERRYGRIVTTASTSGRTASPWTGLPYSSAKAGLIGFTRKLAAEEGRFGITVNVVAPGFVETDFVMTGLEQAPEGFLEKRLAEIPLQRGAHPDELASAMAFLASDDASYVTGAVLDVNGGSFIG